MAPAELSELLSEPTELHYLAAVIKADYTNLSIFQRYFSINCKEAEKRNNVVTLQHLESSAPAALLVAAAPQQRSTHRSVSCSSHVRSSEATAKMLQVNSSNLLSHPNPVDVLVLM